jgi:thiol reductant ABC exporter CydC subunit
VKIVLRLLVLLKPFIGWVALSILLGTATIAASIGLLGTSAYLIARAAEQPSISVLQVAIVGVRFFGISRGVFRYLERLVSHSVNFRLLAQLRVSFYKALEPLAPARIMTAQSGDLLSRAASDIDTLENFYVRAVAPPVIAMVIVSGAALFTGHYHPILGLILAAGLLTAGIFIPLIVRLLSSGPGRASVDQRGRLRAVIVESIQGMPDLLANDRSADYLDDITTLSAGFGRVQKWIAWSGGLSSSLIVFVSGITLWLVLWVAIPMVQEGVFSGISLAVLALISMASFEAVIPLGQVAQHFDSSLQAARRLFDLVDADPEIIEGVKLCQTNRKLSLNIRGLSFRYVPDRAPVLNLINLDLPIGKRMAVVGPSGSGKTTLINILLRFWDFQDGEIILGDCDIRQMKLADVRRVFGVVSQATFIFSGTLRSNLLLANPEANDVQLWQALEYAGLANYVSSLPLQLDTWTGERGVLMSGGERQRLAIARCLLKDASIYLLDEPTANLDAISEQRLLRTIDAITRDRSLLWITHSLAGLEMVDEVVVMNEGRIVQRGRHKELVAQSGLYKNMWIIQNRIMIDLPGTSDAPSTL